MRGGAIGHPLDERLRRAWTVARRAGWVPFALLICLAAGPPSAQTKQELVPIVRAKGEIARDLIERRAREGHRVDDLVSRAQEIARVGKSGDIRRANHLLDQLLVAAWQRGEGRRGATEDADAPFASPRPVTVHGLPEGSGGTPISTEEPFVSRDGRLLFFNTAQHERNKDLHYAEWQDGGWAYRGEIGPGINEPKNVQGNPTMDRHGSFLFIDSGVKTMVRAGRFRPESGRLEGVYEVTGVPPRHARLLAQELEGNMGVELASDGETLFFSRATWELNGIALGRIVGSDLLLARKQGDGFVYDEAEARRVLARVNTRDLEYAASISADGLELFFTRLPAAAIASGEVRSRIMRASRASNAEAFGEPRVVEAIGTRDFVEGPSIAPDGRTLYYHKREGNKFRLYSVTR